METENQDEILSTVCAVPAKELSTYRDQAAAYLEYYQDEISAGIKLEQSDVVSLIKLLRRFPGAERRELQKS